jgi:hypothetical protein
MLSSLHIIATLARWALAELALLAPAATRRGLGCALRPAREPPTAPAP